jgi:hypothetical protein
MFQRTELSQFDVVASSPGEVSREMVLTEPNIELEN